MMMKTIRCVCGGGSVVGADDDDHDEDDESERTYQIPFLFINLHIIPITTPFLTPLSPSSFYTTHPLHTKTVSLSISI